MNLNVGSSTGERMQRCTPVHHLARVARSGLSVGADVLDGHRLAGADPGGTTRRRSPFFYYCCEGLVTVSLGGGDLNAAFDLLAIKVGAATAAGVQAGGLIIEASMKKQIRGGHPKGTKTGATPGGAPQNITGNLRRSVTTGPVQGGGLRYSVDIGPSASYAGFVNDGTSRMPAYPYVEPAAKIAEPAAHAAIVAAWVRALA